MRASRGKHAAEEQPVGVLARRRFCFVARLRLPLRGSLLWPHGRRGQRIHVNEASRARRSGDAGRRAGWRCLAAHTGRLRMSDAVYVSRPPWPLRGIRLSGRLLRARSLREVMSHGRRHTHPPSATRRGAEGVAWVVGWQGCLNVHGEGVCVACRRHVRGAECVPLTVHGEGVRACCIVPGSKQQYPYPYYCTTERTCTCTYMSSMREVKRPRSIYVAPFPTRKLLAV